MTLSNVTWHVPKFNILIKLSVLSRPLTCQIVSWHEKGKGILYSRFCVPSRWFRDSQLHESNQVLNIQDRKKLKTPDEDLLSVARIKKKHSERSDFGRVTKQRLNHTRYSFLGDIIDVLSNMEENHVICECRTFQNCIKTAAISKLSLHRNRDGFIEKPFSNFLLLYFSI